MHTNAFKNKQLTKIKKTKNRKYIYIFHGCNFVAVLKLSTLVLKLDIPHHSEVRCSVDICGFWKGTDSSLKKCNNGILYIQEGSEPHSWLLVM